MPRTARIAPGGLIYHVLNRGVGRMDLFRKEKDYAAFVRCLIDTLKTTAVPVLGYCLMSNHWHLVLWPRRDGDLARFMMRLTITHVRRWVEHRHAVGQGHVYQGRYKSFACQTDDHLWTVLRYVERNPLRAGVVKRAEQWHWSSLGQANSPPELRVTLSDGPQARRRDWVDWVNRAQTAAEEAAMVRCIRQDRPYGDQRWISRTIAKLGWREPLQRGRPKKRKK
jgi:putative transposase